MTGTYPKRLIEVDLPIKRISAHARREKSIRHGHISTLHIWWARRPLAACRAVVCASLWPDPVDDICPPRFVETAKRLMRYWGERHIQKCSADSYPRFNKIVRTPACLDDGMELRKALLDFIADFANWDNSTSAEYLAVARTLTVAAHDALEGTNAFALPESVSVENLNDAIKDAPRPLLVDPFAGGGSIPLEGLRCGADAFASDLNPVAVLLNKVLLEYIPKYGSRLADEVEKWGKWIKEKAEEALTEFYPKDEDGATPIAYLWARTIICEGPGCGAEVPLIRSLWLSKKKNNKHALKIIPALKRNRVDFEIISNPKPNDVGSGTVTRASATCPCCGYTTSSQSVRSQFKNGVREPRLICVITSRDGQKGRFFRLPSKHDYAAYEKAGEQYKGIVVNQTGELSTVPNEAINPLPHSVNRPTIYGMKTWGDIFTPRQIIALTSFVRILKICKQEHSENYQDNGLVSAVEVVLSLAISRLTDICNSLCPWSPNMQQVVHLFGRQAIPMTWDFAEASFLSKASGDFTTTLGNMLKILRSESSLADGGHAEISSATSHPLPDDSAQYLMTDPPYYDAISYADLSDFFYVWLRRCLNQSLPELFQFVEAPKGPEIIVEPTPVANAGIKDSNYYLENMMKAMSEGRRMLAPSGVGVIVFAHKSTDGWEAQLDGMIRAGLVISASWPIDTERQDKVSAIGQARLSSSVHLVCRPREDEDGNVIEQIGDWRDVLSELPGRIAAWLPRLASEGVVGADAIFACLGPALEIFSRYSSVEKASGEVVPLREYLEHVWAEVARQALNMIFEDADASGFEEDARLTAMWLWTLRTEANGNGEDDDKVTSLPGYTLEYDAARKIAQGLGCHLENLTHLVEVKGDKAMLLSAESRARYLFGKEDVRATAKRSKKKVGPVQQDLFSLLGVPDEEETAAERAELEPPPAGKTALDQLHQAMLLFTAGRGAALKRFLVDDGIGANPQFWTLAQAFSALYPSHTNEKRWVDGVLARKKGLGF